MTVRPKPGLAAGIYNDTVNVEFYNCNGEKVTKTVELKFAVENNYTVTVVNGTANMAEAKAGETVKITANIPAEGKYFQGWESADGVSFADATARETTFTMPAKAVTVTAKSEEFTYDGTAHSNDGYDVDGLVGSDAIM